jgi:prefoldin subunit 5
MMKAVKVEDDAYSLLEELSKKTGQSVKDLASKAIKVYYAGMEESPADKEVEEIKENLIVLKYPGKCKKCGRQLNPGDWAFFGYYKFSDGSKKTFLYCVDCYLESHTTDKALARLYVKKRELEKTIAGLKQEANRLTEEILSIKKYEEVLYKLQDIVSSLKDLQQRVATGRAQYADVNIVSKMISEVERLMRDVIDFEFFAKRKASEKARQAQQSSFTRSRFEKTT